MNYELLGAHRSEDVVCFGANGDLKKSDLLADVGAVAAWIDANTPTSDIVVACHDRYFFIVGLLAAWSEQKVICLPHNMQPATVDALLSATGSNAILHDTGSGYGLDLRAIQTRQQLSPRSATALTFDSNTLLARLYTSGSTGVPRAQDKYADEILAEAAMLVDHFDLGKKRILCAASSHHLYGLLFGVLVPLLGGGSTSRETPLHVRTLKECWLKHECSVLISVPPQLTALSASQSPKLYACERTFSSGSALQPSVARKMKEAASPVTEMFGSTETGGIAHRCTASWLPLPGVQIEVNDDEELFLKKGFTRASVPSPYRCADRVRLRADGSFDLLGRSDNVVKIGAKRVDTGEIVEHLRNIEGVDDAVVVSKKTDSVRGTVLYALVQSETVHRESIASALRTNLDPVMVPKRIRVVAAIPRSATGKVSKRDVLAAFEVDTQATHTIEFDIDIPPDHTGFRGHFPGNPILPGVIQLIELTAQRARETWPSLGAIKGLRNVKFKRPITPDDRLRVSLDVTKTGRLKFSLVLSDDPTIICSVGEFVLGDPKD